MPSPMESEIESLVATFVADLTALIQASALVVVEEALQSASTPTRSVSQRRASPTPIRRPKGAKRNPKDLAALTEKLAAFIKKTPGRRIEQIGKDLGMPTKELSLPIRKLIASKRVSTKGQKRATTYFAR